MLHSISIENFKAFGDVQEIPIKPINLIYGPNSSGKSTIIHSLLYASEFHRTGDMNVIHTELGGSAVDLGGFDQFVFQGDTRRNVKLEFNFMFPEENIKSNSIKYPISSATVSLSVGYPITKQNDNEAKLRINSYKIDVNQDNLLNFFEYGELPNELSGELNGNHELLEYIKNYNISELSKFSDIKNELFEILFNNLIFEKFGPYNTNLKLDDNFYADLSKFILKAEKDQLNYLDIPNIFRILLHIFGFNINEIEGEVTNIFRRIEYLGPLRSFPPRHIAFYDNRAPDWFGGGGQAWYEILRNESVRKKINKWLGDEGLETKYRLKTHELIPLDHTKEPIRKQLNEILRNEMSVEFSDSSDATLNQEVKRKTNKNINQIIESIKSNNQLIYPELLLTDLRTNTPVTHRDIGVGISQILPVLVSSFGSKNSIVMVEQPEIHLHPRLQSEIGDVFINSALGKQNNTFLLETHSEYLILRILKRIRQTTSGHLPSHILPIKPEDVSVIYLDPTSEGVEIINLPVTADGKFETNWPRGFFAERGKELFGE